MNHPIQTPTGKLEIEATGLLTSISRMTRSGRRYRSGSKNAIGTMSDLGGERSQKVHSAVHVEPPQVAHPRAAGRCELVPRNTHVQNYRCRTDTTMNRCGFIPATPRRGGSSRTILSKVTTSAARVLFGARVTERIMPGVVYADHGARYDPIVVGEFDRGGAINTLTPHKLTSKNAQGMVDQRIPGGS